MRFSLVEVKKYCTGDNDRRRLCGFNKSNHEFMAFSAIYLHIQFIAAYFFLAHRMHPISPIFVFIALKSLTERDSHHIMQRIYSPCGKVFCHKVHFIRKSFLSKGYFDEMAKDKHHQLNVWKWQR